MQNTLAVQCCQYENLEAKQIFLFRNATHASPTSPRSPLLTETNELFTGAARTDSPRAAAANQDRLQIPATAASQRSLVPLNRNFAEDPTDGTYQANSVRLQLLPPCSPESWWLSCGKDSSTAFLKRSDSKDVHEL